MKAPLPKRRPSPEGTRSRWFHAVRFGVLAGICVATLLSLWALLMLAVGGREAFEKKGTTPLAVILSYYAAGIIGGAIVGAMAPLTRWLPGRILAAVCTAFVSTFCIGVAVHGPPWGWDAADRHWLVFGTIVYGAIFSFISRDWRPE